MSTSDQARPIPASYDADDNPIWQSLTTAPDNSVGQCMMVPDRIIPVIFLPGIMGSNLRGIGEADGYRWRLDSDLTAAEWLFKGPETRKRVLRPETTEVDPDGATPEGTPHTPEELRRRGWGEIAARSYAEALVWLDNALNDFDQACSDSGERVRLTINGLDASKGEALLTRDEVGLSYRYRFPLHACGYNWLVSNAISAKDSLNERIEQIRAHYRGLGKRCDKVILVTHSMGGLVARHYTEVQGGHANVFGVVHGVMPALGAAAVYRRFKSGTEGGGAASVVMGGTGAHMTAVLASAPGALQLLPTPEYGNGWLRIRDEVGEQNLPRNGDPYNEIYTVRGKWWSMAEDRLINPGHNTHRTPVQQRQANLDVDWMSFARLIHLTVRPFHDEIRQKYHPHTYAFIGNDPNNPAYGNVTWTGRTTNIPGSYERVVNERVDLLDQTAIANESSTQRRVTVKLPDTARFPLKHLEFTISDPEERGDGTVPLRSGVAARPASRAFMNVNVGHEPAYKHTEGADNLRACRFTLRCIVKLAQRAQESAVLKYE